MSAGNNDILDREDATDHESVTYNVNHTNHLNHTNNEGYTNHENATNRVNGTSHVNGTNYEEDTNHDEGSDSNNNDKEIPVRELYVRECNVSSPKDATNIVEIYGMVQSCLPGHIFIVDYGNKCIKLLDQSFVQVTHYESVFQPWDLAVIDDSFIVVTFPFVRLMQMFKIKHKMQIFPWFPIKAQNEYYAVCADRKRIIATCKYDGENLTDKPSVHVMDHKGNVELIVDTDADGERLFNDPDYICMDESLQVVYVSDSGNRNIISLNLKGDILATFTNDAFEPRGITFDRKNGYVYVYDNTSQSIHKLDQDLKPLETIVSKREPLTDVLCILYNTKKDKMLVTTYNNCRIKVIYMNDSGFFV
ncbi:hypothetical protein ACF0H5_006169 [Mactra antiquata]